MSKAWTEQEERAAGREELRAILNGKDTAFGSREMLGGGLVRIVLYTDKSPGDFMDSLLQGMLMGQKLKAQTAAKLNSTGYFRRERPEDNIVDYITDMKNIENLSRAMAGRAAG